MLLTNSNGEYGDGSSSKTPHIVGPIRVPPLVAHILQLSRVSLWWGGEVREIARASSLYPSVGVDSRGQ
jgi:hypothetical protein